MNDVFGAAHEYPFPEPPLIVEEGDIEPIERMLALIGAEHDNPEEEAHAIIAALHAQIDAVEPIGLTNLAEARHREQTSSFYWSNLLGVATGLVLALALENFAFKPKIFTVLMCIGASAPIIKQLHSIRPYEGLSTLFHLNFDVEPELWDIAINDYKVFHFASAFIFANSMTTTTCEIFQLLR